MPQFPLVSERATAISSPSGDPASDAVWQIRRASHQEVDGKMAALLRDIFGNPFRRFERNPVWLASVPAKFRDTANHLPGVFNATWLTATVVSLARGIYDERRWQDMPLLADALEEAGCADEAILTHCRAATEHVRGCWVVDLLLGKK